MKHIYKPQRPVPLIKINHTPNGGDHPIKRKSNIKIKDSKFFKNKKPPKKIYKKTRKVKN